MAISRWKLLECRIFEYRNGVYLCSWVIASAYQEIATACGLAMTWNLGR